MTENSKKDELEKVENITAMPKKDDEVKAAPANIEGAKDTGEKETEVEPKADRKIPYQKMPLFKKKICRFCRDKSIQIDYKNAALLERFITDRGKILPRRITGTCSKHQRDLAISIKHARLLALLPFVVK
jgi:small subunit ribosomal protein S18